MFCSNLICICKCLFQDTRHALACDTLQDDCRCLQFNVDVEGSSRKDKVKMDVRLKKSHPISDLWEVWLVEV